MRSEYNKLSLLAAKYFVRLAFTALEMPAWKYLYSLKLIYHEETKYETPCQTIIVQYVNFLSIFLSLLI